MADDGFLFGELTDLQKDMMRGIDELFPKETNKFLKEQATKLRKRTKIVAKRYVGTSKGKKKNWVSSKSYHQKFKIGQIYHYEDDDKNIRTYNNSQHGHLLEYGHWNVSKNIKRPTTRQARKIHQKTVKPTSFTKGYGVLKLAENEYSSLFLSDANEFLYQFVDDTVNGKF